ncbi:hypothetical protein MmiHf6_05370 [Methanimicrococcus hongohii]|uniref:Uncharacterized protein n=1 Tax=Methanimicrococcus hongohii TaxID=3028295 RepID=A0AA96UYX9_9EURY|nr:hypothetical protein [Methanimicrococcus sp. Hf6]WNY23232.1 hypothetical protein MmiHf6_05370 [Methanimicrococcus sp. Hf6]
MWYESFEEIFTYVGKAPELTPKELEETEKMIERMDEDLERQIQRLKMNRRLDGTQYEEGENVLYRYAQK